MNIQDALNESLTQLSLLKSTASGAGTAQNLSNSSFMNALETAVTAINSALQEVTSTTASPSNQGTVTATVPVSTTANVTTTVAQTPQNSTTAIVPQKGVNGYYNQDERPSNPVAPTNIHGGNIKEKMGQYADDQLALAIWQQKEVAISNLALRQRGLYDWPGSPMAPASGSGDWQTEFNWRIQLMRDQGLPVDKYLNTVEGLV